MATQATILNRIVAGVRSRLASEPPDRVALEAAIAARPPPADGLASLSRPGVRVIAEVKRRSPSAGTIGRAPHPERIAGSYERGGAAAISVLTEPDHFGGSLADLERVSAAVAIPCLRKDFVVDNVQLLEARAAGASLVLLIAAVLDDRALRGLREAAEALDLHCLIEAHDAVEVRRARDAGARLIGVNNRDLHTFTIDLAVCERLRACIGEDAIAVAESGITGPPDVMRLRRAGYSAFLVGSSLMRAKDPEAALSALLRAGA